MRLADISNPATRLVLSGMRLSTFTSAELIGVLADQDLAAASGESYRDGLLGELQARAKAGDPIASRTVASYEPGDYVVCACGQLHEADFCPTKAGHGMVL